jgi:hypothetical protein
MPEPQMPMSAAPLLVPGAAEAASRWMAEDAELALGCECADPALQIERWSQECGSPGDGA